MKKAILTICATLVFPGAIRAQESAPLRVQDNFYKAIDAEWIGTHIPREDQPQVSNFTELGDKINKDLQALMGNLAGKKERTPDEQKLVDIYTSYTDMEKRNAAGIDPIREELAAIDGVTSQQGMLQYMATLLALLSLSCVAARVT
jgi:predicted metalloendopeptidase